jgi:hypothetical protein
VTKRLPTSKRKRMLVSPVFVSDRVVEYATTPSCRIMTQSWAECVQSYWGFAADPLSIDKVTLFSPAVRKTG